MRTFLSFLALAFFLAIGPPLAQAQEVDIEVGPRIGYDLGDVEELFIGAEGRFHIEDFPVTLSPAFDYYFTESGFSLVAFHANALYPFELEENDILPYAGAGLGLMRTSVDLDELGSFSDTEIGLNLVGGAQMDMDDFTPYAQANINVGGDATLFGLTVGVLFGL